MSTLNPSDTIQEHSEVYVHNGHWTRYFQRDAHTNHLLSLTPTYTGLMAKRIPEDTTYDQLFRETDSITIESHKPFNYITRQLPDEKSKAITVYAKSLYTDGKLLLTVPQTQTYVVEDPEAFKHVLVPMINDITQEEITIPISDLYTMNTATMADVLYTLATHGTPDEQLYMRVAMTYNRKIKELTDAGQNYNA